MKTKQLIFGAMIGLAIIGVTFTSCKKKSQDDQVDNDTQASSDNSLAEGTFNDAANISDEAGLSGSVSSYKMAPGSEDDHVLTGGCAVITKDTIAKTVTIDFGTSGTCQGLDGKYRSGIIIVGYDKAHFKDSLCTRSITFQNYTVNGHKVDGKKTVQYLGHKNGNKTWTISVTGSSGTGSASITLANGQGTITWARTGTRTLLTGEDKTKPSGIDWLKSKWQIDGTGSGTSSKGQAYTFSIGTGGLVKDFTCAFRCFVSGTFSLTPQGKPVRTVDYGNGSCDNDATVTILGKTYAIKI